MNKILSYFTMLLLSVMTLTLGSCTEEYEYSAEAAKGQQVYFSNTLASTVTITNDGAHFLVPISRVNTDEELTVNITATDESGQLTIPQSVTFEAGQSEANITIDYDPNQITADTYYDVTLSIADADYTTPYGESSYSFSVVMWPPYTVIGTGTFTDAYIGVYNAPVEIRQIDSNPNQFRILRPYEALSGTDGADFLQFTVLHAGDVLPSTGQPVEEDGLVYFDETSLGYDIFGVGTPAEIWHPSLLQNMDITHNRVLAFQDSGLPGAVQLAPYYFAYQSGSSVYGNSQATNDGIITITFPDYTYDPKDYNVSVNYLGAFVSQDGNNYAMGNVTMGADVNEVHVGIVEGSDVNEALNQVLGGAVETITVTSNGEVRIPCSYNGDCVMVAVAYAYDENGTLAMQNYATTAFNFAIGPSQWTSLGTGLYTDHIFCLNLRVDESGTTAPPVQYPVEVQESTTTPGVYRVINPYAPDIYGYKIQGETGYDESQNYNITINAHDPDAVYIQGQPMGFYDDGDAMLIATVGGLNYDLIYPMYGDRTFDILKQAGIIQGTLSNGVITFPAGELLFSFSNIYSQGMAGPANENEATSVLVLPDAVSAQAKAKAMRNVEKLRQAKYSMRGMKTGKANVMNLKKNKVLTVFQLNKNAKLNRK